MLAQRLKIFAASGLLCGALGVAAVGGAFAAPQPVTSTPTATATDTSTSNQSNPAPSANQPNPNQPGPVGPRHFRGGFGEGPAGGQALASFLGMSEQDLHTALKNGQTLAQIAQAHGKTTDQLKTFLTDQAKTRLDEAVEDGRLTSARETQMLSTLSSHLDTIINQKFQPRGPLGPRGGFFFDRSGIAQFLGISEQDLRTALQNGQTLAQIAQAHGKTAADLKSYLLNQDSQRIDKLINTKFQFGPHNRRPGQSPATPQPTATP